MKSSILFLLNLAMVYSEPIPKSMLRGLFNDEKNKFIENSVRLISDSISLQIITNAKLNITHTLFDFACNNQKMNKINKLKIEYTNLYISKKNDYIIRDYDHKAIEYVNQVIWQFEENCSLYSQNAVHYPDYLSNQNIMTYDEGGINIIQKNKYSELYNYYTLSKLYKISDDLIIDLIFYRLNKTFIDISIKYINNDLDCCSYYLITW